MVGWEMSELFLQTLCGTRNLVTLSLRFSCPNWRSFLGDERNAWRIIRQQMTVYDELSAAFRKPESRLSKNRMLRVDGIFRLVQRRIPASKICQTCVQLSAVRACSIERDSVVCGVSRIRGPSKIHIDIFNNAPIRCVRFPRVKFTSNPIVLRGFSYSLSFVLFTPRTYVLNRNLLRSKYFWVSNNTLDLRTKYQQHRKNPIFNAFL